MHGLKGSRYAPEFKENRSEMKKYSLCSGNISGDFSTKVPSKKASQRKEGEGFKNYDKLGHRGVEGLIFSIQDV